MSSDTSYPSSYYSHNSQPWPQLPLSEWKETYTTLHRWFQIIGKVRMKLSPPINHWWHVPLYITSRGLSTSLIPYGQKMFEIIFDFFNHTLIVETSTDEKKILPLQPYTVAEFYNEFMEILERLDIKIKIWPVPVEIEDSTPFYEDKHHRSYDEKYVHNFWQIILQTERVMQQFRSGFIGKCSPVHFFWGGFDLALTRFSGRTAPKHPSITNTADFVTTEAYSHEVSSCGFWPGSGIVQEPAFYSYTYPESPNYKNISVKPDGAFYNEILHEFILPYDIIRTSINPDTALFSFFQSTYEAAADTGQWDRKCLERSE